MKFKSLHESKFWIWILLAATSFAVYPVWFWYVRRLSDGGDEPLGLFALVLALVFSVARGFPEKLGNWRLLGAAFSIAIYAAFEWPPLLRGVWAVTTFSFLVVHGRGWFALFCLAVLSLPLTTSMQFYLGYPIRLVLGEVCAVFLNIIGFAVEAKGAVLEWRGELVIIDAPCSGVQMIWTLAMFSSTVACWYNLDNKQTLCLMRWSGLWVFLGNVVRNVALFLLESGIVEGSLWMHDGIGISVFVAVLWIVYRKAENLQKDDGILEIDRNERVLDAGFGVARSGYITVCTFVFGLQIYAWNFSEKASIERDSNSKLDWEQIDPLWVPVELTPLEEQFARKFPGKLASFRNENEGIVVRRIDRATRMLHSAKDCYRAMGFSIKALPIVKMNDGTFWGRARAAGDDDSVEIRERIVSSDGMSWTDTSSWYWSAILGQSQGPWYSVTIVK
ncbi:exosortase/archaeosortase family protein [Puniceicoccaceae bacterium K14]|nr:exosortase/archaeosortase family protein [Puniceicoccaceae bacterium K14]